MLGISTINVELTSRCNKKCWMCGRRKNEPPDQGDMDYRLFMEILSQLEPGMVVQCHWNGEPTLYPALREVGVALRKRGCIASLNTNGLLLASRWMDLLPFHSVAISIIQRDEPDIYIRQRIGIEKFIAGIKEIGHGPLIQIRALGSVPPVFHDISRFNKGVLWVPRVLHAPEMSHSYRREVTKPEIGVCLDLLHHPAIDRHGDVYPCVRFNPDGINWLGGIGDEPLIDILRGKERKEIIETHLAGYRHAVPLCNKCDYYGCPTAA